MVEGLLSHKFTKQRNVFQLCFFFKFFFHFFWPFCLSTFLDWAAFVTCSWRTNYWCVVYKESLFNRKKNMKKLEKAFFSAFLLVLLLIVLCHDCMSSMPHNKHETSQIYLFVHTKAQNETMTRKRCREKKESRVDYWFDQNSISSCLVQSNHSVSRLHKRAN